VYSQKGDITQQHAPCVQCSMFCSSHHLLIFAVVDVLCRRYLVHKLQLFIYCFITNVAFFVAISVYCANLGCVIRYLFYASLCTIVSVYLRNVSGNVPHVRIVGLYFHCACEEMAFFKFFSSSSRNSGLINNVRSILCNVPRSVEGRRVREV